MNNGTSTRFEIQRTVLNGKKKTEAIAIFLVGGFPPFQIRAKLGMMRNKMIIVQSLSIDRP